MVRALYSAVAVLLLSSGCVRGKPETQPVPVVATPESPKEDTAKAKPAPPTTTKTAPAKAKAAPPPKAAPAPATKGKTAPVAKAPAAKTAAAPLDLEALKTQPGAT